MNRAAHTWKLLAAAHSVMSAACNPDGAHVELGSRTDRIIRLGDGRLVSDTPTSHLPARVTPAPAA